LIEHFNRTPVIGLFLGALMLASAGCSASRVDAPPTSVVFFDDFSTTIDSPGRGVIGQFAKEAQAHPDRMVLVRGFADGVAAPASYQSLSQKRAQAVVDLLVAQGVPGNHITIGARGATQADPGIESRRVDVSFSN
jgi:outer membrane protein OmpA-like peptidoglycan-associated protein